MSVLWGISPAARIRAAVPPSIATTERRRLALQRAHRIATLRSLLIFLIGFTLRSVTLHASDRIVDPASLCMIAIACLLYCEKGSGLL